ncbi:MAG: folate-binding protein YgfZ [Actinobacteria bacterium]|nr:folate-binding protein YgfZ [Actinomycetota bacterium]
MTGHAATVDDRVYTALTAGAALIGPRGAGALELRGDDAPDFLQGQVSNDVEQIAAGSGVYAALLSPKGQMRADMRVLNTGESLLLLCVENQLPPIRQMIESFRIGFRFEVVDRGAESALLSLVGPGSRDLLAAVLGDLAAPGERENDNVTADHGLLAVTTLLGVDLLGPPKTLVTATAALTTAGAVTAGPEAYELARIERGVPRIGAEIDERTIPQEAGLNDRAVSFTKGCYVGQETVARLHYKGKPNRQLRGLVLEAPVAPGVPVTAADGRDLGRVGGVAVSPARGVIALAILRKEASPGDIVSADGVAGRVTEPGENV